MPISEARVATASGARYLAQLCKHWSHRFPETRFSESDGTVPFGPDRACVFKAEPDALLMRIEAADEATLDRLEPVVVEHLKRFAFREDLGDIGWTRGP